MPKGRGRKGGAPPCWKHSSQPAETCTRVAMNVGTQVVSDVGSVGGAAVVYPAHPPSFLPPPPLHVQFNIHLRPIPFSIVLYSHTMATQVESNFHQDI